MLGTLPAAARGQVLEARLYAGIPTTAPGLRAWVDARLGAGACPFLANLSGVPLARAFCFGLRENVTAGVGEAGAPAGPSAAAAAADAPATATGGPWARAWSAPERSLLLYAFGVATGSAPLTAAAVALGARSGGGRPEAAVAADAAAWAAAPDGGGGPTTRRRRASPPPAPSCARRRGGWSACGGGVVERLVAAASPVGAVELASLLSFAEMWRRMEVLFGPEGAAPAA
ncbi:hypothetical protein BU14_0461s0004 [Porphyra umbilicalis]|uniref:Uncharacterized protein n=1 Tax=Porphyra umbilicalis TaxID=2786 RepID=A0A1X6NUV8_PORUM|nr:hypothetical protein BU14_0461s0004 [Porphyra umbilicalis]|eukprot:OSX72163.1 hypothetical protein BU14_0461s0004 [Porphyra umbilicalis]